MSLLVTAFGPFDGGPNCSDVLLSALAADAKRLKRLWSDAVSFAHLDVDSETAPRAFRKAVSSAQPSHVLLMGQAAGREAISIERRAFNERVFAVPDASGRIGELGAVAEAGPWERQATWPDLDGLAQAVMIEGIPACVSEDAGRHLCNQTLYQALALAEGESRPFVTTFLHLPLLPEQAAARGDGLPSLPLDDMMRAVHAILRHTRRLRHEDR